MQKEEELSQQQSKYMETRGYMYPLLWHVHKELPPPTKAGSTRICSSFAYFHYGCDGIADSGWGCAYRTLQSICSKVLSKHGEQPFSVPSIREIQETLVRLGDKEASFAGSHDWIGALEVFYVVDSLYDVACKILHIPQHEELKKYANVLEKYFEEFDGLIMMGGDVDAASKGIAGIHISGNQAYLLVIDPHYIGVPKSAQELIDRGYIRWQHTSEFVDSSFYNFCLPQMNKSHSC